MDDKKTVSQIIDEKSKEFGGKIEIEKYIRFEVGEGLEKINTSWSILCNG